MRRAKKMAEKIEYIASRFGVTKQFVVYAIIGVSGATLDFLLFLLLTAGGAHYLIANIVSTSAGIGNNFFWNAYCNFKRTDKLLVRMASFFAVGMLGLAISSLMLWVFVAYAGFDERVVKLLSIGVIVLLQYTLNKRITFGTFVSEDTKPMRLDHTPLRVAVIGSGFTGLAAAFELSKNDNIHVTVLEHGTTIGGLAGTCTIVGEPIEAAYHHTFLGDRDLRSFIDELGIPDAFTWWPSTVGIFRNSTLYPFMGALDLMRFSELSFTDRLRTGLISLYLQLLPSWHTLQAQTALQWLTKYYGRVVTDVLWKPLLQGKFASYYNNVSMAWLWARIHVRSKSRKNPFGREMLGYPKGGYDVIIQAVVRQLTARGVQIRTDVPVTGVSNAGVLIDKTLESYDRVLLTVPTGVAANLLVGNDATLDLYKTQLRSIEYLSAVTVLFASEQDLSPYYWLTVADPSMPFLVFINHTKLVSETWYHGQNVYYIGAYVAKEDERFTMQDQELIKLWFTGVKKVFPNFDSSLVTEQHVFRFNNAQHIVDAGYADRIPAYATPLPHVYLACFAQIFPEDRGVNYAVREGKKVAQQILESTVSRR